MTDNQVELFGYEDDPEKIRAGEKAFDTTLFTIHTHIDPAYAFITHNFNRVGISHKDLDAIGFIDKDGTPTFGVNYAKFAEYSPVAQVGIIEHNVGHFMSGHVGTRLGSELRDYCMAKYGPQLGKKLYYMAVEAVADSYISYPEALRDEGRPVYDVSKIGLDRWTHTINVLNRMEELIEDNIQEGGSGDENQDVMDALNALADLMGGSGDQSDEDAHSQMADEKDQQQQATDMETGGANVKDMLIHGNRKEALMGEQKIREIVKRAIEKSDPTKSRGWMQGDAAQFVEAEEAQPVIPWFHEVNHHVTSILSEELVQTKKRQNRRAPEIETWPGRIHRGSTQVVFIIDTSGSMGDDDLSKVDAQLDNIAQQVDWVDVVHCDADVAKHEQYRRGMTMQEFWGRGGTTFTPALEYVRDKLVPENNGDWPNIVIYFTDGYGNQLDDDDPIIAPWNSRLIWVLTPDGMSEDDFRSHITELGDMIKVEEW